jgi:hypothetical protein
MVARTTLPYRTSILVRFLAPTDAKTNDTLNNTDTGSTTTLSIFDADKDGVLLADYTSGAETLQTTVLPTAAEVGDTVEVDQNNADPWVTTIASLSPTVGTITLSSGIELNADAGNRAIVRLGSVISGTEFGTPQVGKLDWGFDLPISASHVGLTPGLDVNLEISFVGQVGGDLDVRETICATISDPCNE